MKINNYGEMLEKVKGVKCISFVMFGSYQGEWVAVLDKGDDLELWKGYYGSCSGCDFIEAERDWETEEISDEKANDFFKEDRAFLVIPKSTMKDMSLETFQEIIPANVRNDIYEFNGDELYNEIKNALK